MTPSDQHRRRLNLPLFTYDARRDSYRCYCGYTVTLRFAWLRARIRRLFGLRPPLDRHTHAARGYVR